MSTGEGREEIIVCCWDGHLQLELVVGLIFVILTDCLILFRSNYVNHELCALSDLTQDRREGNIACSWDV